MSKDWLLTVMDRTEEDTPKRHERPLKRQLNYHFIPNPLGKEADLTMEGGCWGQKLPCKWTPTPPPPPWVVLSTILSVLAEKQKLKITINFQFLHCH